MPEPRKVGEWTPEQRSRLLESLLGLGRLAPFGVALRAGVRFLLAPRLFAGFMVVLLVALVAWPERHVVIRGLIYRPNRAVMA